MTTIDTTPDLGTDVAGFEPLRPYGHAATAETNAELEVRLIAANQRAAFLEEQLARVTAERDAAEHRAADLEDRNRELASDLDNALDQLAGHALHEEQERLVSGPRYVNAFYALEETVGWQR
ncbi:hypothetical protein IU450_38610 [Nocardia abscessus]|uniref:hypothetical protein n=1 Tax=Nocardia abscessus TaxID=120957 RepID=UPI001894F14F|nr:hypothetical protein [Nocardia abscessus]MBF6341749.1 hypothetical protein [Nocardia abscessus]